MNIDDAKEWIEIADNDFDSAVNNILTVEITITIICIILLGLKTVLNFGF